jgi:hypothetical protein
MSLVKNPVGGVGGLWIRVKYTGWESIFYIFNLQICEKLSKTSKNWSKRISHRCLFSIIFSKNFNRVWLLMTIFATPSFRNTALKSHFLNRKMKTILCYKHFHANRLEWGLKIESQDQKYFFSQDQKSHFSQDRTIQKALGGHYFRVFF